MIRPPTSRPSPAANREPPPAAHPIAPIRQRTPYPLVMGAVLAAVVAVAMIGITTAQLLGGSSGTPRPDAAPTVAAPPAAYAGCNPLTHELEQVNDLLRHGQNATAAAAAEEALSQQNLCALSTSAIARVWYQASMANLLASPCQDEPAERKYAEQWRMLKGQADHFGVPVDDRASAATLAQEAVKVRCWPLARIAFQEALKAGEFRGSDTSMYYGILWEWGRHLALRTDQRRRGEELLATAHAINREYGLRRDEACQDLKLLGHADCNRVPPDLTDSALPKR